MQNAAACPVHRPHRLHDQSAPDAQPDADADPDRGQPAEDRPERNHDGDPEAGEGLATVPQDKTAVLYCKTGIRSAEMLAVLKKAGFSDALHLQGGIVAWAKQLEPDMVMY